MIFHQGRRSTDLGAHTGNGDFHGGFRTRSYGHACLFYTFDAAGERSSVDLGGWRIIQQKNTHTLRVHAVDTRIVTTDTP